MLSRPVSGNWRAVATASATANASFKRLMAGSAVLSTLSDASSPSKTRQKATRTTKHTKDLPHTFIQDGMPAAPLPDYLGGLEHGSLPLKKSRRVSMARAESVAGTSTETARRRRHATPVSADSPESDPAETVAVGLSADPLHAKASRIKRVRLPTNDLAQAILQNHQRFPDCILLTKVGQFYESYFQQAIEISKLLSIKLAIRRWDGEETPMAGFPVPQLDRYLKILVQTHKRSVAMCEEFRRPGQTEKFTRKVTRILTPGTLIDEPFLNPFENNYLLAISTCATSKSLGLAWIDVSTGEFFSETSELTSLPDDLARIKPSEVVLCPGTSCTQDNHVTSILKEEKYHVNFAQPTKLCLPSNPSGPFSESDNITGEGSNLAFSEEEGKAISLLTSFLRDHLLDHMPEMVSPSRLKRGSRMLIDAQTIRSLEIKESMNGEGITGSLISTIKRTVTQSGTRLLTRWICSPSVCVREIEARQSIVSLFCAKPHLRSDITVMLKGLEDVSRLAQRLTLGRGESDDLLGIRKAIVGWSQLCQRLRIEREIDIQRDPNAIEGWRNMDLLLSHTSDLNHLAKQIESAVDAYDFDRKERIATGIGENNDDEQGEVDLVQVFGRPPYGGRWKIKTDFSDDIARLHVKLSKLNSQKARLEKVLQEKYDASSLTLRLSPSLGLHVHLTKARRDATRLQEDSGFVAIQQSNTTRSYFHAPWTELGTKILDTVNGLLSAEKVAFESLREEVKGKVAALRSNARVMDELDVTTSFSILADELEFTKPQMLPESRLLLITNGRHPTVEMSLLEGGRIFTPNTVDLNDQSSLAVITGPNMGGKSTVLRQTAIITILAQVGSFVPAERAIIGVVDKLFSRIGARDELYRDRSTFMVEMLETANILNTATPFSLVIMDEVGRGTTTKDGLALAFATAHYLESTIRCRALFATHFHELADMFGYNEANHTASPAYPRVRFFCNDVDETDDAHFTYSHRIRPGVNRSSHGLKVARMAGIPETAMGVATNTFHWLHTHTRLTCSEQGGLRGLGVQLAPTPETSLSQ